MKSKKQKKNGSQEPEQNHTGKREQKSQLTIEVSMSQNDLVAFACGLLNKAVRHVQKDLAAMSPEELLQLVCLLMPYVCDDEA